MSVDGISCGGIAEAAEHHHDVVAVDLRAVLVRGHNETRALIRLALRTG